MQLARRLRSLGADVEDAKRRGLHLMYASPVELQVDRIIVSLLQQIQQMGMRRVVIDAIGDLITAASDPQRLHDYLCALVQHFTVRGVTRSSRRERASMPRDPRDGDHREGSQGALKSSSGHRGPPESDVMRSRQRCAGSFISSQNSPRLCAASTKAVNSTGFRT